MVAAALPDIVGCQRSSVLVWDAEAGELVPAASAGLTPPQQDILARTRLPAAQIPALAGMLANHQPRVLNIDAVDPTLRGLFSDLEVLEVAVAPIVADGELLGVVTADFGSAGAQTGLDAETVERLRGIADHAAIAVRNARLLAEIRHRNLHDELTGLPNRTYFLDRLTQALAESAATGSTVAVLFCDLDDFKQVNDSHGHLTGDDLLRQVAARLQDAAPPPVIVARLAGDELALLLPAAGSAEAAAQLARRVRDCFTRPFTADGQHLRITASVGLATHQGPGGRAERMLRDADNSMYRAKRDRTPNTPRPGRPASTRGRRRHSGLRGELDAAVSGGQLRLHYQPIVSLADGSVSAAEALLRWQHPQLGQLEPAHFLPLAQDTNAMPALDLWALRTACHAAACWPPANRGAPAAVAVNLAACTLGDDRLAPTIIEALRDTGLDPRRLILEITETRDLGDLDQTAQRLAALRRLGLRITLDDFGTGFCGLTWLHRLPVDQLKLDSTFTAPLADPTRADDAFVRAVLSGARILGLDVVAEGVEHPAQLAALQRAGYPYAQGHLLGRPSPHLPPQATTVAGPVEPTEGTGLRLVR